MPVALSTDTTKSSWCCANELNSEPFSFLIRSLLFPAKNGFHFLLFRDMLLLRVPLKKKPVAFRLAMLVTLMSSYCMHVKEWKCKPDDVARLNKRSNTGLNISLSYQSSQRTTKYYCCSNNYFFYSKANPKLMLSLQPIRKLIETDVFIQLHYYCTL